MSSDKHARLLAAIDRDIAVCEAATPGPWSLDDLGEMGGVTTGDKGYRIWTDDGYEYTYIPIADARFIARARTLQPATLKAIRDAVELHAPWSGNRCRMCWHDGQPDRACPTWLSLSAPWSEEVERG